MSALGQKQTCAMQNGMSALPPIADMCGAKRDVRFVPIADIHVCSVIRVASHDNYAASVLRTPSVLIARCSINWGSRSPVATTLTIALAISSVIGSSRLAMPRLTSALS